MDKNAEVLLNAWLNDYGDNLYSWAVHKLRSEDLAKDLLQETFIAALQGWDRFEGKSSVKTWLTSILNNKIRDHFRKEKKGMFSLEAMAGERNIDDFFDAKGTWKAEHRPMPWDEEKKELLDTPGFREVLFNCLNGLSERFRNVVTSKYLDERESSEICQELGISASNYWQILHRAKLQLRACLDGNWFKQNSA